MFCPPSPPQILLLDRPLTWISSCLIWYSTTGTLQSNILQFSGDRLALNMNTISPIPGPHPLERLQRSGFLVCNEIRRFQVHPYHSYVGTGIRAYGTIGPKYSGQDPISLYTLNNNSPTTYHGKAEVNSQYRKLFFQSPVLHSGIHELTVTNGAEGVVFFLDYFLVNSLDTTASLSSSHHQSKTADLATLTVTQDTLSTGAAGSVHSAVKGIQRTALVGALTGLIILALVVLGCFLNARRRRLVGRNHTYCGPGCKLSIRLFFSPHNSPYHSREWPRNRQRIIARYTSLVDFTNEAPRDSRFLSTTYLPSAKTCQPPCLCLPDISSWDSRHSWLSSEPSSNFWA